MGGQHLKVSQYQVVVPPGKFAFVVVRAADVLVPQGIHQVRKIQNICQTYTEHPVPFVMYSSYMFAGWNCTVGFT